MTHPFARFLFFYLILLNLGLFHVASNYETDVPLREAGRLGTQPR